MLWLALMWCLLIQYDTHTWRGVSSTQATYTSMWRSNPKPLAVGA